jgi:hypothetical protein
MATAYKTLSPNNVLHKILLKLGRRNIGDLKQHLFTSAGVPAGTGATTGLAAGDLVYDTTNDDVYQFTSTATFTKVFD